MTARPRIRYWTPGAAVTEDALRKDVDTFYRQGFGGVEVVALPAADVPPQSAWGSAAWARLTEVVATATQRRGMGVSFTDGPAWPIAMPGVGSADDPAALYELSYGSIAVGSGGYSGEVPHPRVRHEQGVSRLAAVTAYRQADERHLIYGSAVRLIPDARSGRIALPADAKGGNWRILAFWEQPAAQKVGSLYVIDHLSKAGAAAVGKYWDQALGSGRGIPNLTDIFNDSLEYKVSMEWTRGFLQRFRLRNGYDLVPFLPFIGTSKTYPKNDVAGFETVEPGLGGKVNADYLDTLTELYSRDHLAQLERVAASHKTTMRYQVAYNKPYSVETAALFVGVPETEGLGRNAVNGLRQMAGAVHVSGKPLYSFESAAEFGNDYGQTVTDILWWNRRAWAAGVNIQTLHGAAYDGARLDGSGKVIYPAGTRWPGYTGLTGAVSTKWNRPTSEAALRSATNYMARVNFVLQKAAKVDLAIYREGLDPFVDPDAAHGDGKALVSDDDVIADAGYSYDFLSPVVLGMAARRIRGGTFAADGPSYRAIVLPQLEEISVRTLTTLSQLARSGVAVVFVGTLPDRARTYSETIRGGGDGAVRAAILALRQLPNVVHVPNFGALGPELRRRGVLPAASVVGGGGGLTVQHRVEGGTDYYYLHNGNRVSDRDAVSVVPASPERTSYPRLDQSKLVGRTVTVAFEGQGMPFLLDAWTGRIEPVASYRRRGGRTIVTLPFDGDEAKLIAISRLPLNRNAGSVARPVSRPPDLIASYPNPVAARGPGAAVAIQDWTLSIDSLQPSPTGSPSFYDSVSTRRGPFRIGGRLRPWRELSPDLSDVSGTATYSGSFVLPEGADRGAVMLDVGPTDEPVLVTVNGVRVSGVSPERSSVNISGSVQPGTNEVRLETSSTLYNRVRGGGRDYGLRGKDGVIAVRFDPIRLGSAAAPRGRKGKDQTGSAP